MRLQQFIEDGEPLVTHHETDGRKKVVADLGAAVDATVDVTDGLALVTVDGETTELELPGDPERAFIRNGVLTIELEGDA